MNNEEVEDILMEDNTKGNFEHEIETKEEKANEDLLNKKRGKASQKNSSSENEEDYSSFKQKARKKSYNPNRKKALANLLEFYLSDDNLINDKYLSNKIKKNPGIEIGIFLKFNKIKNILCDINDISNQKHLLIKACENSKKIYVLNDKIYRINKYDPNSIDYTMIDECTIYVENLPKNITHEIMFSIFNQWKVKYISIPKYKTQESKGFAFITFSKKIDAIDAMNKINNTVPKEIINLKPKELNPLLVFPKKEWLEKKEKFKQLKQQIQKLNQSKFEHFYSDNNNNNNVKNIFDCSLIKVNNIENDVKLEDIQIFTKNYISPVFIDYDNRKGEAFFRFNHKNSAKQFIELFNDGNKKIKNQEIKLEIVTGEEEKEYYEKVQKLQKEFQIKKQNKKKDNK